MALGTTLGTRRRGKPAIKITRTDNERLWRLAESYSVRNPAVSDQLLAELERARVVEDDAVGGDTVGLGSIVKVKDLEADDEWEYTIVDASSADPGNDRISYSSPIGQALMKRKVGDKIVILIPAGTVHYEITGLRHE